MAREIYNSNNLKRGRLLASGRGVCNMLDVCYRKGWTDKNTILIVDNTDDMDSKWRLYGVRDHTGKKRVENATETQ